MKHRTGLRFKLGNVGSLNLLNIIVNSPIADVIFARHNSRICEAKMGIELHRRSRESSSNSTARFSLSVRVIHIIITAALFFSNTAWAVESEFRYFFKRQDDVLVYFDFEMADTTAKRSRGLMERQLLQPRAGMLFDFEHSSRIRMWMKKTLISLDMIFLDDQKKIVHIHQAAEPLSLTIIQTPYDARFTVEINAGEVQHYGLSVGDRLFAQ
jgi:uncharacterized membrane protein (UPF0127 family)